MPRTLPQPTIRRQQEEMHGLGSVMDWAWILQTMVRSGDTAEWTLQTVARRDGGLTASFHRATGHTLIVQVLGVGLMQTPLSGPLSGIAIQRVHVRPRPSPRERRLERERQERFERQNRSRSPSYQEG